MKRLIFCLFFAISVISLFSQVKITNLRCELLSNDGLFIVNDKQPDFAWVVESDYQNDVQKAYEIIIADSEQSINKNSGNVWTSGKIKGAESTNIQYKGNQHLKPNTSYYWKVKVWTKKHRNPVYSEVGTFVTGDFKHNYYTSRYKLTEELVSPKQIIKKADKHFFIDFGKAAFGTLAVFLPNNVLTDSVEVRLGESIIDKTTVDIKPAGTIRGWVGKLKLKKFKNYSILELPNFVHPTWAKPDEHVSIPHEIENIMPFRYCEIININANISTQNIKQVAIIYPFNDKASSFISSSDTLNQIWDLCKYSIKATNYCGVYVDGDRERKPYEADAYINQLSHYCVDSEYALARYSMEYFFTKPTWPTEWKSHSVIMAWDDYLYTGNTEFLSHFYEQLVKDKTFLKPLNEQGLLKCTYRAGNLKNDIVDWPAVERDGYELLDVNLVPNAFYYRSIVIMADIAKVLGKTDDYTQFTKEAQTLKNTINNTFFNPQSGLYFDAIGSVHNSLHGNMFPLVFGLVDAKYKAKILSFIKSRGMACSVYGAQYLLDALYQEGEAEYALSLLTSDSDRSWWNMIRIGSTITLEAWDIKYKPNLDWNHAWGAAPANIIPRRLFGIIPLEPAFNRFEIKPQTANLKHGTVMKPTIKGLVTVSFNNDSDNEVYSLEVQIPVNTKADVFMPKKYGDDLYLNGKKQRIKSEGNYFKITLGAGKYELKNKNVQK